MVIYWLFFSGVRKGVSRRLLPHSHHLQQRSGGIRSQTLSKDAPSKEVDPVTKRMLSARLLKINELKNALSELRLHGDELQRENRLLRQMQLRQEKALHHYNDTESEISQLLSQSQQWDSCTAWEAETQSREPAHSWAQPQGNGCPAPALS